ncbi:hypothetical protein BFS16_04705 [Hoylesella timonensis]|uniref:Uncharacterized protein n=1 Tax=Hoylesella timonensis TaxID=386414 RepID=A0A2K0XMC4_9BACT|nr:hypothetical protein BFS16_04705 [Hoylesella timonensis]
MKKNLDSFVSTKNCKAEIDSHDLQSLLTSFALFVVTTMTFQRKSDVSDHMAICNKDICCFCPIILPKIDHLKSSK